MTDVEEKIRQLRAWENKKETLSTYCLSNSERLLNRYAFRGSIYLVNFGENLGVEINRRRPALVLSPNGFNRYSGAITVVPITKNLIYDDDNQEKPKYSYHYFVSKSDYPFLDFNSCIECEQIRTISKSRIIKFLGNLNSKDISIVSSKVHNFIS
ncbi:Endoribonuclease MazF9 [Lactiplantibacillus plantarum]|uniref:type II toxin-antitoxin system PemK/MazF family toxin n=1 Tax=Lactiplantibacillus plantarum TaxID=1590 RepID=UPI0007B553AC|nr:type II toxin-antitoxin system PemK/MazF family toxin [Lactiplantibacillus plantarum]VFI64711.1 Endoribonuclease MazF9 [Lactiplantibacillus plantarum]VFI64788.1 Endoribonuclease MazF9 [Lactiplantibacillus plantarum]